MRWALLIAFAVATGGCSILLEPDRDAIVRGMDAGPDARVDAGPDARVDAGCVPEQAFETSCDDGVDNDCDGLIDCQEPECGASGFCCDTGGGGIWGDLSPFGTWDMHGLVRSADDGLVEFGTSPTDVSLSFNVCAPIAFGMTFLLDFRFEPGSGSEEYASFVLAPVDEPRGGSFLAEFRLRVDGTGRATAERAGTVIGETMIGMGTNTPSRVSLQPGVDDLGRPVLFVTVDIGGVFIAEEHILMPLSDLRPSSAGCTPDGLFVVVEGRGTRVTIVSALRADTGDCDSPTLFLDDSGGPLMRIADEFESAPTMEWRDGGLGEPALANFWVAGDPMMTERLEVFADTSTRERRDEFLQPTSFSIGGVIFTPRPNARHRGLMGPELFGPIPSSREPSVFAVTVDGVISEQLLLAYARIEDAGGDFEIALTEIGPRVSVVPDVGYTVLRGGTDVSDCQELRDPSVIALGPNPTVDGLLIFYTCDPTGTDPSWIGAARLEWFDDPGEYRQMEVFLRLLTSDLGEFAQQGVFSPEVIVTSTAEGIIDLRVWFLAKSSVGRARLAFAYGRVDEMGTPRLSAFGGNPILDPEDPILGGACPMGCSIDSVGVLRPVTMGFWREPSYVFLVERSVYDAAGVTHQLIPLRQPRPNGG